MGAGLDAPIIVVTDGIEAPIVGTRCVVVDMSDGADPPIIGIAPGNSGIVRASSRGADAPIAPTAWANRGGIPPSNCNKLLSIGAPMPVIVAKFSQDRFDERIEKSTTTPIRTMMSIFVDFCIFL
jgi:hypothetical protein